jgi:hypothetical protein
MRQLRMGNRAREHRLQLTRDRVFQLLRS